MRRKLRRCRRSSETVRLLVERALASLLAPVIATWGRPVAAARKTPGSMPLVGRCRRTSPTRHADRLASGTGSTRSRNPTRQQLNRPESLRRHELSPCPRVCTVVGLSVPAVRPSLERYRTLDQLTLWILAAFGLSSLLLGMGEKLAGELEAFLDAWSRPLRRLRRWCARARRNRE
jgi:hypothetical protein